MISTGVSTDGYAQCASARCVLNRAALKGSALQVPLQVRKEIEGSFFLIEKTLAPFHQIIILNKKNAG